MTTLSIWKDQIILRTRLPAEELAALKEHIKFSERLQAYTLAFSKQNLQRIYKAFGQIPVIEGRSRIAHLRAKLAQFNEVVSKAELAKTSPTLPEYPYKVPPLAPYQHRGVVYLVNVKSGALFVDCGCGKTFMVACSSELHIKKGLVAPGKTLICGKLATLHQGWMGDIKRFTDLKATCLWLPTAYKRKEKIRKLLDEPADVYIINHDGVRIYEKELAEKQFQKVVIDESTILKSFRSEYAKAKGGSFARSVMKVAAHADYRVIMSGTPAPNGPEDLFGQIKFLDPCGFLLEASWRDFRQEYMLPEYFGDPSDPNTLKVYKFDEERLDEVGEKITKLAYRVKIRDVLPDLPERTIVTRTVVMAPEQEAHYKTMTEQMFAHVDEALVSTTNKLTQIIKLRQITSGFIIDAEEAPHPISNDNPKLEMLDDLLREEIDSDNKVVMFAQYRWEFEQIAERYKDLGVVTYYGDNTASEKMRNLDAFINGTEARIIVLHPKSCAHGVTLTMAHYMIFYSISYSAEEDYQCIKRIERNSQRHKMFVYYLLAARSIDEVMFAVIRHKQERQASMIDGSDDGGNEIDMIWAKLKEQYENRQQSSRRKKG